MEAISHLNQQKVNEINANLFQEPPSEETLKLNTEALDSQRINNLEFYIT